MFKRKGGGKPKGKASNTDGGGKPKAKTNTKPRTSSASGANPFDVRGNTGRAKYEVLGKRVKGTGRDVAQARAQAELKRRRTLGAEFRARNKSNDFRDRRLGEQDPSMSLEDKMMARFQTERKRKLRNAQLFALHDSDKEDAEDEDEAGGDALFLTHQGRKITDDYDAQNADGPMDEFDNDDEQGRQLDRDIVNKLHFGGGNGDGDKNEDGSDRKKTHKEVMHEVMMKAKLFKAERQKTKANQEDVTEQLDQGFDDIRGMLEFRPTRGSGRDKDAERGPMDEFDKLTRELAFEAKAKATERRLSPEEAAKKEHDRLEELERKRVARMKGEEEESDDSDDEGGKKRGKKGKKKGKKGEKKDPQLIMMPPTDDDLMDGYEVDKRFGAAAAGSDEEAEEGDDDEQEEEEEEEEDSDADSDDDDGEKKSNEDEEDEEEEDEVEDEVDADEGADAAEDKPVSEEDALPFVFPCPETPEELRALFDEHAKRSPAARALIVERLITYYSPRLSVANQQKMKRLFAILLRQFLRWASRYDAHKQDVRHLNVSFGACMSVH
jgi:nucleolar protein 14